MKVCTTTVTQLAKVNMKQAVFLLLALLLYATPALSDCLELPIIGNGIEPKGKAESQWSDSEGSYRPKIPDTLVKLYPKLAGTFTTVGFPRIIKGKPEFTTVVTCFLDSIKIPAGLGPMTRDQAAMFAHSRDAKIPFNPDALKLPEPKPAVQQLIDKGARLFWRLLSPALAWATTSTDDFNRGSGSDLGAAWDPYNDGASTDCTLDTDRVTGTADSARCVEGYSTYIPGANQYVKLVLKESGWSGFKDVSAYLRLAAPTTLTGYACRIAPSSETNRSRIRRYDGGGFNSNLGDDTAEVWVDGDELRCEVRGDTITLKKNGVTILNAPGETSYGSGRGGLGVLSSPSSGNANWADDFEVGDLPTTSVVRHRPILIQ